MGALIVLGIISILMIIGGIVLIVNHEDVFIVLFVIALALIGALIGCLVSGRSIKKSKFDYFTQKEQIEYLLENAPNYFAIKQAENYNDTVQSGNNYWCRFSIEDRSEYIIDIDKYIARKGEK